jgi:hypothetical protein
MERLTKAALYGAGLIEVSTPVMTQRYNRSLEQLGIEGTLLEKFHIDCVGWSPEVAQEKGSNLYLTHGLPNQLAVILTPDQWRRPIYFPLNSFERRMIDSFFQRFEAEIADITSTNAVVLAIDQGISEFTIPQDLLQVDSVVIRASADNNLMESALIQKNLVERFMNEKGAWLDTTLRTHMKESAETVGDLRSRRVVIPESVFSDLRSFYSEALGGVFVIRTEPGQDDILVVHNKELISGGRRAPKNVLWLYDPKLVERLYMYREILDINFDWYRQNLEVLDYKLECLAADVICSADPDINFRKLNKTQRKSKLLSIKSSMPQTYFQLERIRKMLERGVHPSFDDLPTELQLILLHPHGNLPAWYKSVIWQLICRLTQHDPLCLYSADKNRFFEMYQTWPDSKKDWAVEIIARNYVPHSSNKE